MEYFIDKVRLHPCLWKTSEISYRDLEKKGMAWEQVARECGMANGREAKFHWKKLRDSHREALRRRKTATGQPTQNMPPWKYEAQMEFILTQNDNSKGFSNYSNTSEDIHQDTKDNSDTTNHIFIECPMPESPLPSTSVIEPENKNRRRRREQRQNERDDLRRRMVDMIRSPPDALSNLFSSLCQKTRELPKILQLRVQREIFESITRAEEEALSLASANAYYNASPTTP